MTKFEVTYHRDQYATIIIEAETEEEAWEKAEDMWPEDSDFEASDYYVPDVVNVEEG